MGHEIVYCFKCLRRLTSGDFERGLGLRLGSKISCTECLPDLVASLTPEEHRQFAKELAARHGPPRPDAARGSSSKHPRIRPSSTRLNAPSPPAASSQQRWIFVTLAAAGGVTLIALLLFVTGGGGKQARRPAPSPPKALAEDPRHRAAREAVERARKAPRGDLEAQIASWAEAVRLSQDTPSFREASETHQALLGERANALARERGEIDAQARPLLEREEFRAAMDLYERARGRHAAPEWRDAIDRAAKEARARADAAFGALKAQAAEARRRGAEADVKAARERVARWQLRELSDDLERHLATIAPAERPWVPVFDGKSTDFLNAQARPAWEVQGGALVRLEDNAAQTVREFGDGEVRIRFEASGMDILWFVMRQAGAEGFKVSWNTTAFQPLDGQRCDLIFICRGETVTAALNGQPLPVTANGRPRQGLLQFNGRARVLRILSIDWRELP
jgi:hypothetical protein